MKDNAALVAEAREHIDNLADSAPADVGQLIRAGTIADNRISLIVRLADALAATLPKKGARYVVVRPASDDPKPGELVQSKWQDNGTVWRIITVRPIGFGRAKAYELDVVSLTSGRRGQRHSNNLSVVEEVE